MYKPRGFTIVELLIVIVVIGILAAITIVAYSGIQQRAAVSSLQADLTGAAKELEKYKFTLSSTERYPSDLATANLKASDGNAFTYTPYTTTAGGVNSGYCLQSTNSTATYYTTAGGSWQLGACQTVTNLAKQPYLKTGNGSWTGYNAAGGDTKAVSPNTNNGRGAFRMTSGSAGIATLSNLGLEYQGTAIAVPSGTTVYPSIYVQANKAGVYSLMCQFFNGTTQIAGDCTAGGVNVPANQWTRLTSNGPVVVPSPADKMNIRARYVSGTTWTTGDWFEVTMVSTAVGAYADGDSPNWSWSGGVNNSTSSGPAL